MFYKFVTCIMDALRKAAVYQVDIPCYKFNHNIIRKNILF